MKSIILCFFIIGSLLAYQNEEDNEASSSGNAYASDPKVKHSLFLDKNQWNCISGSQQGVPLKNEFI